MNRTPGGTDGPPRFAIESVAGRRLHQEDAAIHRLLPDGRTLVAVADGLGGHAAGEVASALAIDELAQAMNDGSDLAQAFRFANSRVHAGSLEPDTRGMGTTLVAAILDGRALTFANVGDSRGYTLSGGGIRQVTNDHSFVAEALARGTPESEIPALRWRDHLTRAIGIEPEVDVDVFGPFEVEPDTAILLCSDGLYKALDRDRIRKVYERNEGSEDPGTAAEALVSAAFDAGSDDNITVLIASCGS